MRILTFHAATRAFIHHVPGRSSVPFTASNAFSIFSCAHAIFFPVSIGAGSEEAWYNASFEAVRASIIRSSLVLMCIVLEYGVERFGTFRLLFSGVTVLVTLTLSPRRRGHLQLAPQFVLHCMCGNSKSQGHLWDGKLPVTFQPESKTCAMP